MMSFARSLMVVILSTIIPCGLFGQDSRSTAVSGSSNPAPPVADAGPVQTVPAGSKVVLNGSGSSNPSGVGTLSYRWEFSSIPHGSQSTLNDVSSVMPSFVLDAPGAYVVKLTVDNGAASSSSSVTVSSAKSPPVAQAGANQTVALGANAILDGSGSWDVDGNLL